MAAYRRVYDSHHLQADCQGPGNSTLCNRVLATFTFYLSRCCRPGSVVRVTHRWAAPGQPGGAESAVYGCVVCRACVQVVFPDVEAAFYEHEEVQSIMLYVLRHYHFLADVDRGTATLTARTSARQWRDAVGNEHTHTHTPV